MIGIKEEEIGEEMVEETVEETEGEMGEGVVEGMGKEMIDMKEEEKEEETGKEEEAEEDMVVIEIDREIFRMVIKEKGETIKIEVREKTLGGLVTEEIIIKVMEETFQKLPKINQEEVMAILKKKVISLKQFPHKPNLK